MDVSFDNFVSLLAGLFGNSTTLAGLVMLVGAWAVCVVICMNMKASPAYSALPMIPLAIFFSAYGILNETIMILIVIVSSALVASEFKKTVN